MRAHCKVSSSSGEAQVAAAVPGSLKPAAAFMLNACAALGAIPEVFDLNKSAMRFFRWRGRRAHCCHSSSLVLRRFPAGESDAPVAAAGEAEVAAVVLAFGLGFSAGEGDAPVHRATRQVINKEIRSFEFMDSRLSKRRRKG